MVTDKEKNSHQKNWPRWRWFFVGLNLLALVLSIILSWHFLRGSSMAGCGGGSPCDNVLSSRWSVIAGVLPVSGLAVGAYLAMLFAGFFIGTATEGSIRRMAWSAILVLAGSVAGSAIWFTIIQKWMIGDFCPYCMSVHITGFILAVLVIRQSIKEIDINTNNSQQRSSKANQNNSSTIEHRIFRPTSVIGLVFFGLLMTGILVAVQIGINPPAAYHDGESQVNMPQLDYKTTPIVGSADAPYIVTLLFDYQCSHCQKIHFMLDEAVRQYDGKLAFVLCPAPLNTQCNPYIPRDVDAFKNSCDLARIGLAVWVADRDVFPVFENWMFTFDSGDGWYPRSLDAVRAKAVELLGQEQFDKALTDPWIGQYIQTSTRIYGQTLQTGKGGIPKMIFGSRWVIPEPSNSDDLVSILQKSLGVPNP
jgi:uncharacterized membrane protein